MSIFVTTDYLTIRWYLMVLCVVVLVYGKICWAQDKQVTSETSEEQEQLTTTTIGHQKQSPILKGRASSSIDQKQIKEEVIRSTPEALSDEVGAYVQQTAHGQGSVYLRGRTGRHTLLLVDGFRLNHALFRQGPNQYLFTIDPLSVNRIDILRGGGSVELGSNALAGSILVYSKRPNIDPYATEMKLNLSLTGLYASADLSRGLRGELNAQLNKRWGLYLSIGWLNREELEASGPLPLSPNTPEALALEKNVPRFQKNQRLQMGTGYTALSTDTVSRLKLDKGEWIIAARLFRQYDSPRTDQCPPPEAPETWCLNYDEQFRTHIYSTWQQETTSQLAHKLWLGLSFQRQHERRSNDRDNYVNIGRDSVNVWALRTHLSSRLWRIGDHLISLEYGADSTFEYVSSKSWDTLVRSDITRAKSRGQYIEGSEYKRAGTWSQAKWTYGPLSLRTGARVSYAHAYAPQDVDTESVSINRSWLGLTLGGGLTWRLSPQWSLLVNLEEGFAPPNLDDLTARQLTGQGYQIENPSLKAESSLTSELGTQYIQSWHKVALKVEFWGFLMRLYDGIERRDAACPMSERSCIAARVSTPFTLTNLKAPAHVYGVEHQTSLKLPYQITISEYISYANGKGPSPLSREVGQTRPLSRIPPLNGGLKLRWDSPSKLFYTQLSVRWASAQNDLSFGDEIDHRVPYGGTPKFQVYHAQLGLRDGAWTLNLNLENLGDTVYRIHGSSVNGAARGLSLFLTHNI
jgi:outer membrane receptor protein involved in Fe transport